MVFPPQSHACPPQSRSRYTTVHMLPAVRISRHSSAQILGRFSCSRQGAVHVCAKSCRSQSRAPSKCLKCIKPSRAKLRGRWCLPSCHQLYLVCRRGSRPGLLVVVLVLVAHSTLHIKHQSHKRGCMQTVLGSRTMSGAG